MVQTAADYAALLATVPGVPELAGASAWTTGGSGVAWLGTP